MRLLEMLLLVLPSLAQAQLMFTMNNDGSLNITGYSGSNGIVIIPSTINGLPVDSVGDSAFYDYTNPTSMAIGTNVITIGGQAFYSCE